jgi:glycosyltransferase involved in cell wall biosynthesis
MKFSIVTPTYNSASTIRACAESVLRQDYSNYEHIIVDNFSSDKTLKIVRDIYQEYGAEDHLVVVSVKDDGIADAFNKGIQAAKGEVVAILNCDDEFYDDGLLSRNAEIFKSGEYLFSQGDIVITDSADGTQIKKPLMCSILVDDPYNHSGMFVRKLLYLSQGLYDIDYMYSMNYEISLRWELHIPDFRKHGWYIKDKPVVAAHAREVSWVCELRNIKEIRAAQMKHRVWNWQTMCNYYRRFLKIKTEAIIAHYHLDRYFKSKQARRK